MGRGAEMGRAPESDVLVARLPKFSEHSTSKRYSFTRRLERSENHYVVNVDRGGGTAVNVGSEDERDHVI